MCEIRGPTCWKRLAAKKHLSRCRVHGFRPRTCTNRCWWQTQCLDDWGALPFRICHPSAVSLIHKEIRTSTSPVPKPCIGYPTIPFENFSIYSWLLIYRIFRKRFHSILYLSLTLRFIGDQILGWLYLKSIRHEIPVQKAQGFSMKATSQRFHQKFTNLAGPWPMYPTGPKQKLD